MIDKIIYENLRLIVMKYEIVYRNIQSPIIEYDFFIQNQSSILCYVQNDRIRVLMHPFSINYNQSSQAIN